MRPRTCTLAVLLVALLVPAAAAAAGHPPRAELRGGGERARLGSWSWDWTSPSGPGCVTAIADGIPSYRPLIAVEHRHARPRIVFLSDVEPVVRHFRSYKRLGPQGHPVGRGKHVRFREYPKVRNGETAAWAVRFRVNAVRRPYFDLTARFPAQAECDGGSAAYAFGIERE